MPLDIGSTVAGVGASILKGQNTKKGIGAAIQAEQDAYGKNTGVIDNTLNTITGDAKGYNNQVRTDVSPYTAAGTAGLSQISNPNTLLSNFYNSPNAAFLAAPGAALQNPNWNFQADPGYAFTQNQGTQAVNQSKAVNGLLLSGSALKALDKYSTGLANQTYGDWFNRQNTLSNENYSRQTGAYDDFTQQNRDLANIGLQGTQLETGAGATALGTEANAGEAAANQGITNNQTLAGVTGNGAIATSNASNNTLGGIIGAINPLLSSLGGLSIGGTSSYGKGG